MSDSDKSLLAELEIEHKQIEQAHQEWMTALDSMKDPIFLHDSEFRILRANLAYQRCAGLSFHDIIGRRYYEIFPQMAGPFPSCLKAMESHATEGEDEIVLNDRIYRSRAFSVHDEQGKFLYSIHIFEDTTERNRAEEGIRAAKDLLQSVVENAPIRVFWKDRNLKYLGCNSAFARDAGFSTPEEVIGKDDYQMGWREQAELYRADDKRVMDSDTSKLGYEEPQSTSDGYTTWLRTSKVPLHGADGRIFGLLGIYEDITERKRAEEELRMRVDDLNRAQAITHLGSWSWDMATETYTWSDELFRIFGVDPKNFVPSNDKLWELIHPDDRSLHREHVAAAMRGEAVGPFESRIVRPGGEERVVFSSGFEPGRDASGKLVSLFGTILDITERKQAEQKLMKDEKLLNEMGRMAKIGAWEFDPNTGEGTWTEEVARIHDMEPSEPTSRDLGLSFYESESRQRIEAAVKAAIKDGTPYDLELEMVTAKGNRKWVRSIGRPVFERGKVVRLGGSFQDITERKQHELLMQRANRALRTISAGNQVLIHAIEEEQLLHEMCDVAVNVGGYCMAWVGYAEDDANKSVRPVASAGHEEGYLESVQVSWADVEHGRGPTGRAIRSGQTQVAQNMLLDSTLAPWRQEAGRRGYAASIALPLREHDKCFGALTIYDDEPDAFDPDEVKLLEEMADDLAFGITTLRVRKAHREHEQRLQKNMLQTVEAIASIVEMRDPYTSGHQIRVAEVAREIAREMGQTEEEMQVIHLAGLVHDLGKIQVPAEILSKPRRLNDLEYKLIQTHSQAGYDILKGIDFSWPIAQMVLQHHERMDGSGYPQGLKGDQILLGARILCVADVVEAMSSHRPYRPGLGIDAALEEISRQRGILFDAQVVDACLILFREHGYRLPS